MPDVDVPIRLVLVDPPPGVDFGIQKGRGSRYEAVLVQQRSGPDLAFDFSVTAVGDGIAGVPDFRGPFVQGPRGGRFFYVDVGTYAGQQETCWSRRIKVPLGGIAWPLIRTVIRTAGAVLCARIRGTGPDGGPSCGTAAPVAGWTVIGPAATLARPLQHSPPASERRAPPIAKRGRQR